MYRLYYAAAFVAVAAAVVALLPFVLVFLAIYALGALMALFL